MSEITKVKSVTADGTWESKYGLLYQWQVELENGKSGRVNTKNQKPWFEVGSEVEIKDYKEGVDQYGNKWSNMKLDKPDGQKSFKSGGGGYKGRTAEENKSIAVQSAFKAALDFHVAEGYQSVDHSQKILELCNTAEIIGNKIIEVSGL